MMSSLLYINKNGLYCEKGDFYIDPWKPVDTALVTHGHSDHSTPGHKKYYCTTPSVPIISHRLGEIDVTGIEYSEELEFNGVTVSFHPAGHILGSSQIRVDDGNEVWLFSGDYKRQPDPTCKPFEVVTCDTFITEATFALPIYRWPPVDEVITEIADWINSNKNENKTSIIFSYALGKSQRLLAELKSKFDSPVYIHGALEALINVYRDQGIEMLDTINATEKEKGFDFSDKLVLAPPSAFRSKWMQRFKNSTNASVSGWMAVRAQKTQGGFDSGFVLSDHCDWYDLIRTIKETEASEVLVTHGRTDILARYLEEEFEIVASGLKTAYSDKND